jgi:hypothetical protein
LVEKLTWLEIGRTKVYVWNVKTVFHIDIKSQCKWQICAKLSVGFTGMSTKGHNK